MLVRLEQNHMATVFSFTIHCLTHEERVATIVLLECHGKIGELEAELSEFLSGSAVARFNRSEPGDSTVFSSSAMNVLHDALRLRELTNMAFDPFAKSMEVVSPERFGVDFSTLTISRSDKGVHLSLGAIGKGFALDCVRSHIERAGFQDYLLDAGGSSMVFSGYQDDNQPWIWGWSWLNAQQQPNPMGVEFSHNSGVSISLGISGTSQKGFHILDPRVGSVIRSAKSALVAHSSAAWADALSTALFVDGWLDMADRFTAFDEIPGAAVIDEGGIARWNGRFNHLWGPVSM